ncbi:hypothetical protein ACLOJK_020660 [Asimina triloba]
MRAKLDEARDNAKGVFLAKQDLERPLAEATTDEAVSSTAAAREEALRLSAGLVALTSEAEALHAHSAGPDIRGEPSRAELEVVRGEALALQKRIAILGSRESELFAESEAAQEEVARLRTELMMSRGGLERLQAASSQGGDTLSLGSISVSTHASVIVKYLRSNVYQRREEFEHSHHSQSGYVKALSDVDILFPSIDLSSLYQTP